jgi:hypothetical protein
MSFRRGAALSTATTLGYADTADLGPTAGNGFYRRWPDDLASLQDVGVTDVRLTLDWARLQPKPDTFDADWAERFEQMIAAAAAIDLAVWATLHDGSIPRWFDNEGGLGDDVAVTRWWPRWVERSADRFGDTVAGWIPFTLVPPDLPEQPWRDTWGILGAGQPVVASIDPDRTAAGTFSGLATSVGPVLAVDWERDSPVADHDLERVSHGWGRIVRDVADDADLPIVIAGFDPCHDDADVAAQIVGQLTTTLDDAIADGVVIELCFLEPAIGVPDHRSGVLDADRSLTPAGRLYLGT